MGSPGKLERAAFPQYWPFPASPCRRAANQKGREFVVGLCGSANRIRTKSLLVTGSQPFTSLKQLTELASAWPPERLAEIWNSLPGVEPVKGFQSATAAAGLAEGAAAMHDHLTARKQFFDRPHGSRRKVARERVKKAA